ncbi:MAG: hypothetical protein ACTSRW_16020 [Candidatus Helarchaeota archaeon]
MRLRAPGAIKRNKKIKITYETIHDNIEGICAVCGKPWHLDRYYDEFLLKHPKYGIVHEECVESWLRVIHSKKDLA